MCTVTLRITCAYDASSSWPPLWLQCFKPGRRENIQCHLSTMNLPHHPQIEMAGARGAKAGLGFFAFCVAIAFVLGPTPTWTITWYKHMVQAWKNQMRVSR